MPLYDYDCANCGRRFEAIHGVHAAGPATCPLCGGGPVRKAITAAAVHFKGSGWAKKERGAAARAGSSKTTKDAGDGSGTSSGDGDGGSGSSGPAKAPVTTDAATETGTAASSSD
jgi:putative FmdB family regulatory protein